MSRKWLVRSVALVALSGASAMLLSAQIRSAPIGYRSALPGTVNYVEGQAFINGTPLSTRQNGTTQVEPNQDLTTANGKVEMLLSPGVFVRLADKSDIRLVSNGLANPAVEVVSGEALVEVDGKATDAQISILQHGVTALLLKPGLYRFDANQNRIAVFDGRLKVTEDGRTKELGKGREALLTSPKFKTEGFDAKASQDDLYRWSSVRSSYLAQASRQVAENAYYGYGPYWGAGWYWDPYFAMWSWLPGDGWFYSPFGYPFFSPGFVVYSRGFYGFHGGYAGRFGAAGFAAGSFRGGGFAGGGGGGRR